MLEKQHADGGASLEIEQDLSTQTKIWKFERFGCCVLTVIVAAGDGLSLIIIGDGRLLDDRLRQSRIELADVLGAGRKLHGLTRIEQLLYVVLESSGGISIIPRAGHAVQGDLDSRPC
ncbi:MAG: DUF421 domain-containing protein [Sphingomonadales bacterium]|nr:DUF421 domain-containing protein [Sphingomonadales bacterium]